MKLNNKGMSVVELVLSFTILMVIVFGMFQIIHSLNQDALNYKKEKELLEFKTLLTSKIQDDLIMLDFKTLSECINIIETEAITCNNIEFSDEVIKQLNINTDTKTITYDNIKYEIPNKDFIDFIDVSINNKNNEFLEIIIPIYRKGIDLNYGIRIIHPIVIGGSHE